jgi:hypothetical protein
MDRLVEGHYYKHTQSNQLIVILKIDLETGFITSKIINTDSPTPEIVAPVDFYLFNYRYYSP